MADNLGYAVVPTQIIYPGEEIDSKRLQTVEVTNKNLSHTPVVRLRRPVSPFINSARKMPMATMSARTSACSP